MLRIDYPNLSDRLYNELELQLSTKVKNSVSFILNKYPGINFIDFLFDLSKL
jgi:hypothetical protein